MKVVKDFKEMKKLFIVVTFFILILLSISIKLKMQKKQSLIFYQI